MIQSCVIFLNMSIQCCLAESGLRDHAQTTSSKETDRPFVLTFDDIDRGTDFINDDVVSSQKILKFIFIN